MREITTVLYTFDELSDEAKQVAISEFLSGEGYPVDHIHDECSKSLSAFSDHFNAKTNYSVGAFCYSSVTIDSHLDDDILQLKGKRLISWIVKHTDFIDRKPKIFKLTSGKVKTSKVIFDDHYNLENCNLTGVCYDIDLTKNFC